MCRIIWSASSKFSKQAQGELMHEQVLVLLLDTKDSHAKVPKLGMCCCCRNIFIRVTVYLAGFLLGKLPDKFPDTKCHEQALKEVSTLKS